MTVNETLTRPSETDGFTDGPFHHHLAPGCTLQRYLNAHDSGAPLNALCGAVRSPHPNPLELPCCPRCRSMMQTTCPGGAS